MTRLVAETFGGVSKASRNHPQLVVELALVHFNKALVDLGFETVPLLEAIRK